MEDGKSFKVSDRQKQSACLECRKSKTKCIRAPEGAACRKCRTSGTACVVPAYHIGRYKGVKNKRSGLEKAIHQVETAVKKSRKGDSRLDEQQTQALELLLRQTGDTGESGQSSSYSPVDASQVPSPPVRAYPHHNQRPVSASHDESFVNTAEDTGDLTVDNADNPLQLLAVASTIPEPSSSNDASPAGHGVRDDSHGISGNGDSTQRFFTPIKSKLDNSADIDPIDLGLATEFEAQNLFEYFHMHLAHTRWGMDSKIHTWMFVRSRSAFLFTSIMAASALFLTDTASLSQRLRNHVLKLAGIIAAQKYRSMEIVLGLMINIPWMVVGEEWATDDNTCYYISTALTIALDLSMNRIVIPSVALHSPGFLDRIARADCIDAKKALATDCLDHLDPSSDTGKRLLRARERIWLALFNLDRGVCLARGRPPTVPVTALLESCDTWHICDIADAQDGALVSATVLRRDFVGLVGSIRSTCDSQPLTIGKNSTTIRVMRDRIEKFFDQWLDTWRFEIQQSDGSIAPYVEILASHTKLSAYCNVINHPTAPVDVRKFFRTAGLASALNVLKVAVQAETRLRSMPNNTVILVSFAAFFALGLSNDSPGRAPSITSAPNVSSLIDEVADVLQRLGSIPKHRQGASVWFGKHIKAVTQRFMVSQSHVQSQLRTHSPGLYNDATIMTTSIPRSNGSNLDFAMPVVNGMQLPPANTGADIFVPALEEFPVFDMTNDQIIDSIINSKDDLDVFNGDLLYNDSQFLDWFDSLG